MTTIFEKLEPVLRRNQEIEESMALPEVAVDFEKIQELAKERASLENLVGIGNKYKKLSQEQSDLKALVAEGGDLELATMSKEELQTTE